MSDFANGPADINQLLAIMVRLRDPTRGCPWDVEQNFDTIAPYTIEEAYEVADAIANRDADGLCDELGDLLFQVVFHARMAEEAGDFSFSDVVAAVCDKMIRRHPHVFAEQTGIDSAERQTENWEQQKAEERQSQAQRNGDTPPSVLDGVVVGLPGLTRAVKLQNRAARVGFDWPNITPVFSKLREELGELEAELATEDHARLEDEMGDILFVCANLARHLKVDPEAALRSTNRKFIRRFKYMEAELSAEDKDPQDLGLAALDELWDQAKAAERNKTD